MRPFAVAIDYGSRFGAQLRYEVEYDDAATGLRARRLTLEHRHGVGFGDWDFLTADNLAESVGLLTEVGRHSGSTCGSGVTRCGLVPLVACIVALRPGKASQEPCYEVEHLLMKAVPAEGPPHVVP